MHVKFNQVDEFCEELERDAGSPQGVDRGIVRVTNLWTASKTVPSIKFAKVIATYSHRGQIVRLEHMCGDYWLEVETPENDKTMERAAADHATVKEACERLGLELRSGTLEE